MTWNVSIRKSVPVVTNEDGTTYEMAIVSAKDSQIVLNGLVQLQDLPPDTVAWEGLLRTGPSPDFLSVARWYNEVFWKLQLAALNAPIIAQVDVRDAVIYQKLLGRKGFHVQIIGGSLAGQPPITYTDPKGKVVGTDDQVLLIPPRG